MKENIVKNKSFAFAVRIVRLYQFLCKDRKEYVLSKQILRSGTSIGANVEEADGGISKSDFQVKFLLPIKNPKKLIIGSDY